jgi:hypothetical protein
VFQTFKTVQAVPALPRSSPADAGEDEGGGIEPFGLAQDRLHEAIEQLELWNLWTQKRMKADANS